jgi:hypothetical protein
MGNNVVALEVVEFIFPRDAPPTQAFLTRDNKCRNMGKTIKTRVIADEPRRSRVRIIA